MKEPSLGTAQSVKQRLLNRALERKEDFNLTLGRYGVERFLYRLGRSPFGGRYVVKGATLFTVWLAEPHRPTRDLDLNWLQEGTRVELESNLRQIFQQECPEDGLVFDPESLVFQSIRQAQENQGLRVKLLAWLGDAKIHLRLDIGFSDVINPEPKLERFPTLLDDLPRPRVKLYPKETFVAEKFEAMLRLGERNSRLKDFADVALLAWNMEFQGAELRRAFEGTLQRRATQLDPGDRPAALRSAFYSDTVRMKEWQARAAENLPIEHLGSLPKVGELLISFLGPLWEAIARKEETWAPTWKPQGPWV